MLGLCWISWQWPIESLQFSRLCYHSAFTSAQRFFSHSTQHEGFLHLHQQLWQRSCHGTGFLGFRVCICVCNFNYFHVSCVLVQVTSDFTAPLSAFPATTTHPGRSGVTDIRTQTGCSSSSFSTNISHCCAATWASILFTLPSVSHWKKPFKSILKCVSQQSEKTI